MDLLSGKAQVKHNPLVKDASWQGIYDVWWKGG